MFTRIICRILLAIFLHSVVNGTLAQLVSSPQGVPGLINYQGRLTDAAGLALPNGPYSVEFRLFNKKSSGEQDEKLIWGRVYEVTLVNGAFNVILGSGGTEIAGAAVNDIGFAFNEPDRFLTLKVVRTPNGPASSPTETAPRQQMLSSPYAMNAMNAVNGVPPGTIVAFGGDQVPPGWLLCDGSALDRENSTYSRLYSAIGAVWGDGTRASYHAKFPAIVSGSEKTDFNLPDLRGIFLRGVNGDRNDDYRDELDDNKIPKRTNLLGGNSNSVGSYQFDMYKKHNHTYIRASHFTGGATSFGIIADNAVPDDVRTLDGQILDNGGFETRPKNAAVNYMIKL